ncbi:ABC transporter permease [Adhaeribacter aquaticus]|uniref:ABC transporter permease n=1 Tax=Adhaeribacter aquaticus TaxID=299567 RepID=UPI00041001CB|nr:ABC transporter permease [Adhaeribacter aquaticus]
MWAYFGKRLLLAAPTIWVIGSVIFVLSKVVPGNYKDLLQQTEGTISTGNQVIQSHADYLQSLKTTGADKPLFYFSIYSKAEPDTLAKVFPVRHQVFLQKLIYQYGNWPAIAAYYKSLLKWEQQVLGTNVLLLQKQTQVLFTETDPQKITQLLNKIEKRQMQAPGSLILRTHYLLVRNNFARLEQEAQPINNLIPVIKWHGSENQYNSWLGNFVRGELGNSYRDGQPVTKIICRAISNTLILLLGCLLLIFALAVELSLVLTRNKKSRWQACVLSFLYVLDSIPLFIVAFLLLIFLAGSGYLHIFPLFGLSSGMGAAQGWWGKFLEQVPHLVLPGICLILAGLPYVTVQLYQKLQEVMQAEFITTARAKGLPNNLVLRRHVFRNALLPLITLFTGYLPSLISGALVIEVIFAIPGTGRLLAESVLARDYPVVLGLVLFAATLKVGSHLLTDFLYFSADPRTRIKP